MVNVKHYHDAMRVLTTVTDYGAVGLWLAAIFEFISTQSVMYTMPIILMYFGAIIVVFGVLTYLIEKE